MTGNLNRVASLPLKPRRKVLAQQNILRAIIWPGTIWGVLGIAARDLPPGMCNPHPSSKIFFAESKRLIEVSADQRDILRAASSEPSAADFHGDGQHRRETYSFVVPESAWNFRQISFVEKRTIARRLENDSTNFMMTRVFLSCYHEVPGS